VHELGYWLPRNNALTHSVSKFSLLKILQISPVDPSPRRPPSNKYWWSCSVVIALGASHSAHPSIQHQYNTAWNCNNCVPATAWRNVQTASLYLLYATANARNKTPAFKKSYELKLTRNDSNVHYCSKWH